MKHQINVSNSPNYSHEAELLERAVSAIRAAQRKATIIVCEIVANRHMNEIEELMNQIKEETK